MHFKRFGWLLCHYRGPAWLLFLFSWVTQQHCASSDCTIWTNTSPSCFFVFFSTIPGTTLLFYASLFTIVVSKLYMILFFSTLAWLQPYKSVQVFVMFSSDNILEHVTASCPVFARCCLFTVVCDFKRKNKAKQTVIWRRFSSKCLIDQIIFMTAFDILVIYILPFKKVIPYRAFNFKWIKLNEEESSKQPYIQDVSGFRAKRWRETEAKIKVKRWSDYFYVNDELCMCVHASLCVSMSAHVSACILVCNWKTIKMFLVWRESGTLDK